jgi:hypothetical protein
MTRSKCGLLLLLAAGAGACGGDPTGSFAETGKEISTDPSVVFVNQGANVFVTAQLLDEQGNQLPVNFQPTDVDSKISVVEDTAFLETTNGTKLNTRQRFIVSGLTVGTSGFTVTGGGNLTQPVPVRVLPTSIAATFSTATPAINEAATITLPAGYTFSPDATVESGLGSGLVQSVSPDGTSLSVVLIPGSTGPLTLGGVGFSDLPGVPLTLPSTEAIAASSTQLPGSDSPNTGPIIPVPALGGTVNFFDTGALANPDITGDGGVGAQYYRFTVTEAGDYHFVTNWPNAADLDAIVCFDAGCNDGALAGSGSTQPEDGTLTLEPGTYFYSVVLFEGDAPPYFQLTLTHEVPSTGD